MDDQSCPVCGGVIDAGRLAEAALKQGANGFVVVETPMLPERASEEARRTINSVLGVRQALDRLDRACGSIRMIGVLFLAYGVGSLLAGDWSMAPAAMICAAISLFVSRSVRSGLAEARDRFDEGTNAAASSVGVSPDDAANN